MNLYFHGRSLYFRGRSMARIVGHNPVPHRLVIHPKYVVKDRIGEFAGQRSGSYLVFDVTAGFADAYAAELPALMLKAGENVGHEENVEVRLLQRNDGAAEVCCFDRQVQVPGTRRTIDIVGLTSKSAPVLVAIEVKRFPDNRIQYVPGQLHEYLEILDPDRKGLRDDVAESYRTVCRQLLRLDRPAPDPGRFTAGMPVMGLVIVNGHNPRSKLLPAGAPAGGEDRATDFPVGTGVWRVRGSGARSMAANGSGKVVTPAAMATLIVRTWTEKHGARLPGPHAGRLGRPWSTML